VLKVSDVKLNFPVEGGYRSSRKLLFWRSSCPDLKMCLDIIELQNPVFCFHIVHSGQAGNLTL